MKRVDERNTMFARANYKRDSRVYKDYYSKNPEKRILMIVLELDQVY